jgi:hypothetical protein
MKPNLTKEECDSQFRKECDQIELLTGKKWQWVINNYTLPELFRLKAAMLFLDMI